METTDKGRELERLASNFVDKYFNFIQVHVLEKMVDGMLFEYIRQEEPDYLEFIANYGLHSEFKDATGEEAEQADEDTLREFCEQESSFENWMDEQRDSNYPMWNTCFEFRSEPSEEMVQAAINAGFGVIEGMDDFNTTLFVAGCGYSFYGQHWIPLFLNLPWNESLKKEYEGVKYDMY